MPEISYSSHFERAFRNMSAQVKNQALEKERIFRRDCFDPQLKTHKLKGRLEGCWSFSINHAYRILFSFAEDGSVLFIDAGDHSIYD